MELFELGLHSLSVDMGNPAWQKASGATCVAVVPDCTEGSMAMGQPDPKAERIQRASLSHHLLQRFSLVIKDILCPLMQYIQT